MATAEDSDLSGVSQKLLSKRSAYPIQERHTKASAEKKARKAKCKEIFSCKAPDAVRAQRVADAIMDAATMPGENSVYAAAAILDAKAVTLGTWRPVIDVDALILRGLSVKETVKRIFRAY